MQRHCKHFIDCDQGIHHFSFCFSPISGPLYQLFGVIWSTGYVNILFNISQAQNEATVRPIKIRKRDKKLPVLAQNLTPTRHGAEINVTQSLSGPYSPKLPYHFWVHWLNDDLSTFTPAK